MTELVPAWCSDPRDDRPAVRFFRCLCRCGFLAGREGAQGKQGARHPRRGRWRLVRKIPPRHRLFGGHHDQVFRHRVRAGGRHRHRSTRPAARVVQRLGGRVAWAAADSQHLPFGEASFDVVNCTHIYEHVPDAARLMDEIFRVLRPGGICFFSAGNRLSYMSPTIAFRCFRWCPNWSRIAICDPRSGQPLL